MRKAETRKIYFDHNATTPVAPEAREAMGPYLDGKFGNPSSAHSAGREAREAVAKARRQVAALINADPSEVVFTSGGSEGDNMAIKGVLFHYLKQHGINKNKNKNKNGKLKHIVTSTVEHPAVLETFAFARQFFGFETSYLGVDASGMVDPDELRRAIREDTVLVSVMAANNETGNIFPVSGLASIAREKGIIFHTDAVQLVGKAPVDVRELGVDMLTASGHKFGAPKGTGFQYVRNGIKVPPAFITGGPHEHGLRAGTENVPGIAALGAACELLMSSMQEKARTVGALRDRLENGLLRNIRETELNGHKEKRIYNTSNISFKYIEAEAVLQLLDMQGIEVSTGSACSSETSEPSHVLQAMGLLPVCSRGAIRFSLGPGNTEEEVDHCLRVLPPIVERLQKMSPLFPA